MDLHVDLSWILEVAERAGQGDPQPDDLGVPVAAVARHRAELLDAPVYGGTYARAAALAHTLGRCRWLERSNLTVACAATVMYLAASGIDVHPDKQHLRALAEELYDPRSTTARIVELLRSWPV
ncbi:fic family toxin-antitoxin system, toxin component [Streptomyces sp. NPDC002896]|uniref:fic family toxin-antitoxin system, toxin component n=1 Tax=Streptomyces sp. NPDC002896 TaxID=3154438 RepID=UPI0033297111